MASIPDGSYHYSGEGSKQFWKRVDNKKLSLEDRNYLYTLGCILQDVESRVLRALTEAEVKSKIR